MRKGTLLLLLSANIILAQNPKDAFVKAVSNATNAVAEQNSAKPSKLTISQATLKAINEVRLKNQICANAAPALKWNENLYTIAKEHSLDMAINKKLQHNGSGTISDKTAKRLGLNRGSFFFERVNQKKDSKAKLSGELIIKTDLISLKSPKDVIDYWIKRPNDCKVLMDPRFTDVAMAKVVANSEKRAYWTLLLMGERKKK